MKSPALRPLLRRSPIDRSTVNEPVGPTPGDAMRTSLKARLKSMCRVRGIPNFIGGEERTGDTRKVTMPHSHRETVAAFHLAGPTQLNQAVEAAARAKPSWEAFGWHERAAIFMKAADLLAGPWRDTINAATMLGQSKNIFQAEIDAACEMADFFRFNAHFYQRIVAEQPISSAGVYNRVDHRPLEGFVLAITPFNFTAIAVNLCAAPAMLGNTVVLKPSDTPMLSPSYTYKLLEEAGLPPGVLTLVAADGPVVGQAHDATGACWRISRLDSDLSTIWKTVGENIARYKTHPVWWVKPAARISFSYTRRLMSRLRLPRSSVAPLSTRVRNVRRHRARTYQPPSGTAFVTEWSTKFAPLRWVTCVISGIS